MFFTSSSGRFSENHCVAEILVLYARKNAVSEKREKRMTGKSALYQLVRSAANGAVSRTGHSCKAQQDKSVELTDCGQSDPLLPQRMQAQHSIAVEAELLLQCSLFRGIGHSFIQVSVHVKPAIRHACANVCS